MKTAIQDIKTLHATDEQIVEKQTWTTPVLKVLPVERARKAAGSTIDGSDYLS